MFPDIGAAAVVEARFEHAAAIGREAEAGEIHGFAGRAERSAGTVEPGKLAGHPSSAVQHQTVGRDRSIDQPQFGNTAYRVGQRVRIANQLEGPIVKLLRYQSGSSKPHQVATPSAHSGRRVQSIGAVGQDERPVARVGQRGRVHSAVFRPVAGGKEQKTPSRENLGPVVGGFPARTVGCGERGRSPTGGRNPKQAVKILPEQNEAVTAPSAAATRRRHFTDDLRRSARDVRAQQLGSGKEANGPAVGRPERVGGALRSRQGACADSIQRSHPEAGLAAHTRSIGHEPPVRRQGSAARIQSQDETPAFGRHDRNPEQTLLGGPLKATRQYPTAKCSQGKNRGGNPPAPRRKRRRRPLLHRPEERALEIQCVLKALIRFLGQTGPDNPVKRGGDIQRGGLVLQDRGNDSGAAAGIEGPSAGQQFIEHASKGEHIATCVGFLALNLLRRHVVQGAEDFALRRHGPL